MTKPKTQHFYDTIGWQHCGGKLTDLHLFGVVEDGPIRKALHAIHIQRVREALGHAGSLLNLLECGCGGNPELSLLGLCSAYTGVDFSSVGLEMASQRLSSTAVPGKFVKADICDLPFDDGQFDAVYSAHVLYHIPDFEAQKKALDEMLRVLRPFGVMVLITANPYPMLFPVRFARRLIASTPGISALANAIRPRPPLPYLPMRLSMLRAHLAKYGAVEIVSHGMPSIAFNQRVTEYRGVGRRLWRAIQRIDTTAPRAAAALGNYVQVTLRRQR